MIQLFLFTLACYGWTNIMVYGSIFDSWRQLWIKLNPNFLGKLFTCMMCLSFWVGVVMSVFIYSPSIHNNITDGYLAIFFDACFASGVVWLLHTIQEYYEK